jgi:hypothetical protein
MDSNADANALLEQHCEGNARASKSKSNSSLEQETLSGNSAGLALVGASDPEEKARKPPKQLAKHKADLDVNDLPPIYLRVATSIYNRHPRGEGRRNMTVAKIAMAIFGIVKRAGITGESNVEAYLIRIDRKHQRRTHSEQWQTPQFVTALTNYFSIASGNDHYDPDTDADDEDDTQPSLGFTPAPRGLTAKEIHERG